MALIKCQECGQMVSNRAEVCPKCGFPIRKNLNTNICIYRDITVQLFRKYALMDENGKVYANIQEDKDICWDILLNFPGNKLVVALLGGKQDVAEVDITPNQDNYIDLKYAVFGGLSLTQVEPFTYKNEATTVTDCADID